MPKSTHPDALPITEMAKLPVSPSTSQTHNQASMCLVSAKQVTKMSIFATLTILLLHQISYHAGSSIFALGRESNDRSTYFFGFILYFVIFLSKQTKNQPVNRPHPSGKVQGVRVQEGIL